LDRPFIVTFIGGLILAAVANHWHAVQQRTNLQLELMRKFPTVYNTDTSQLNSWLAHIVWVAEEKNKSAAADQKKIASWSAELAHAQDEFYKSQSLEDLLVPIQAVFHSPDVQTAVDALGKKWQELQDLTAKTSRDYNDGNESLSITEAASAEASRRNIAKELDADKAKLLKALAAELTS
jgi:hypothetical protein